MSNQQYPPPGGWPSPDNGSSANNYPPPQGYGSAGNYPPAGGYNPPNTGGYPPPTGGYNAPGNYPPPGGSNNYQSPYQGYGQQQQMFAPNYDTIAGMQKASFGIRFVALIIDLVIAGIVGGILSAILPRGIVAALGGTIGYAIYAVLTSLYFDGATVGKMALGLKVVDQNGRTPELIPLILRYSIGYWISSVIFFIGFIWAAFDSQKQALHDKIARTYVVQRTRRY